MEQTIDSDIRRHGHGAAPGGGRSGRPVAASRALARWLGMVACAVPWMAQAQSVPVISRPVIEQAPGRGSTALGSALARLGRNPGDIEALIEAGNAALDTGDTDAAVGFFARADRLSPNNPRIMAGLAGAKTMADDAIGALALFDAIPAGTAIAPDRIADHGLAADLVGDNAGAQTFYLQALAAGAGDEARRRLGISLAIAGDARGSGAALSPLLQKQDRAAWRTRAFALAILGQEEDAVAIAKAIMPADLAMGMAPYLRYMRRLTRAQQASAANLGHFPMPSAIGIDDPRVVAWQQAHGVAHLAGADRAGAGLAPERTGMMAAPAMAPGGERNGAAMAGDVPAEGGAGGRGGAPGAGHEPPPEPQPSVERRVAIAAAGAPWPVAPSSVVARAVVQPTASGAAPPAAIATPADTSGRAAATAAPPARRASFAEAFAAFAGAPAPAALPAGAVDVRRLGSAPPPGAGGVDAPRVAMAAAAATAADARPHRSGAMVPPASDAARGHGRDGGDAADGGATVAPASVGRRGRAAADDGDAATTPAASARNRPGHPRGDATEAAQDAAGTGGGARPGHRRGSGDSADTGDAAADEARSGHDRTGKGAESADDAAVDGRSLRRRGGGPAMASAGDDKTGSGRHRHTDTPPPPAHPARIWVQVGIGRSHDRVAYDWKRMAADDPKLFKDRTPAVSAWGRTRRVLIGPFDSEDAAAAYAAKAKKAGHGDAFVWHSPAGQAVDPVATD